MLSDMTRKKERYIDAELIWLKFPKGTFVRDAWYITDYDLPTLLIPCPLKSNGLIYEDDETIYFSSHLIGSSSSWGLISFLASLGMWYMLTARYV